MAVGIGRRHFISAIGGAAAAWPLAARAQPERLRWIGVLMDIYTPADSEGQSRLAAFQEAFQKLGWTVGRNVRIEARWAAGDPNRLRAFAAELVGITPDVILCMGVSAVAIMQQATRTIPVVFVQTSDPVGSGFVTSLARPGGNITGFTNFEPEMSGKWLGLLKEATPNMSRVAVLFHAETANSLAFLQVIEAVAPSLGVQVTAASIHDGVEIERNIATFASEPDGGLIVSPHPIFAANRGLIIALAARYRLPAIYAVQYFAAEGGLMSYGSDQIDQWRAAARYVDRILKGESPGDLPVQQPTKYTLVINLKTAKALGLTVPESLLATADEVIE
jgi:putative ABC transport system substrate-binding protein